ncbi:MAG: hypothetical protein ACLPLR_08400 [Terriglobales bacterium]
MKRAALVVSLSAVILVAGVSAYLRIEQYRFRRQAERLLSDVRELELKKASAAEVRLVVRKWGFEERRSPFDPCTDDNCIYRFQLMAEPNRAHNFPIWGPTARVFEWLGLRSTVVEAWLQIRGKALRSVSFIVYTMGRGCDGRDCTLMGYAATNQWDGSFSAHDQPDVKLKHSLLHPSYLVGTYPTTLGSYGFSGVTVWAEFSPDANAADVSRLMQFDLSCLTNLRSCRARELMPMVWAQSVRDDQESPKNLTCTPELERRVAQLADVIVVVLPETIALTQSRREGWPPALQNLEIVSVVKKPQHPGQLGRLDVRAEGPAMNTADTQSPIQGGHQYLFLLQGSSGWRELFPCGILTPNAPNLAMVREAVADGKD